MTTYIHGPRNSPALIKKLKALEKTPGTCLFIDLVGSTATKYDRQVEDWARMINNTFSYLSFLKEVSDHIVKGIGDEIMIFIPDDKLHHGRFLTNYHSILSELCSTMFTLKYSPLEDDFYPCKMVIHYCEDVYNISFLNGFTDYYGTDIDLAARLMSKAKPNTVVVSEAFYQKVEKDIVDGALQPMEQIVDTVGDATYEGFRGIPDQVGYRILDI